MEQQIETLIGQYGWMAVVAFIFLLGRKTIESTIEAIKELVFGRPLYLFMK